MKRLFRRPTNEGSLPVVPGAILPDALYRLDEAAARMGWGAHALRAARRRGLKVHRCGKRGYIAGRDLLAFVTQERGSDAK
jgi:hypothetical protein